MNFNNFLWRKPDYVFSSSDFLMISVIAMYSNGHQFFPCSKCPRGIYNDREDGFCIPCSHGREPGGTSSDDCNGETSYFSKSSDFDEVDKLDELDESHESPMHE